MKKRQSLRSFSQKFFFLKKSRMSLQHEKSATRRKCNMKRVQHEESATGKERNAKKNTKKTA